MIKFHGTSPDDREMLGLGLSRKNCERLLAGQPIFIDLDKMASAGSGLKMRGVILIIGGETEEAMTDEMHKGGALEHARVFGFDERKEQKP